MTSERETHMEITTNRQSTYTDVPLIQKNYFILLCKQQGLGSGGYRIRANRQGERTTYIITATTTATQEVMQRVLEDAQG